MNTPLRFTALALALAAGAGVQAQHSGDPLKPIVDCVAAGGHLQALEQTRLPANITSRRVDTAQGPARVSVIDGWRLLLAPRGSSTPSLNLKIERSLPTGFDADRTVLRGQIAYFVSRAPLELPLRDETIGGVELLALKRPTGVVGGAAGVAMLFHPATQVVFSATFLDAATHETSLQHLLDCAALPLAE